jgi:hypothetical protein
MVSRRAVLTAALALTLAAVAALVAVVLGGARSSEPRAASGEAVVWAVGDGADGSAGSKALAARVAAGRVDRFLYLGDVYEEGTYDEFESNYAPVYGRFGPRTAPTPGNHEWPNRTRGYDRYWTDVQGRGPPPYYAFSMAGWTVLALNSEGPHEPGSEQLRWLDEQLGPGNCRIAFWHRPRYSAGTRHGDQHDIEPLWQALHGRVAMVVNGHEHNSQRFKPRDRIVQLVAGAGGHGLYPLRPDPRLAFGDDRRLAALRLVLSPGRARYAFVAADGRRLDSGEVGCRS